MKNLHILPTDKASRLHYYNHIDPLGLSKEYLQWKQGRNIYITSDEEIKSGDYFWKPDCNMIFKAEYTPHKGCKKVILTTDTDLIKDGVQAIDDDFLEWFVKNPSCEFVEILIKTKTFDKDGFISSVICDTKNVEKIYSIIPQEEPKQEPCDNCNNDICCCTIRTQETIVKSAKNYYDIIAEKSSLYGRDEYIAYSQGVQDGVKFQQERMYSEEEVINAFNEGQALNVRGKLIQGKDWFEQNKKK
jgi:hypothetical protein